MKGLIICFSFLFSLIFCANAQKSSDAIAIGINTKTDKTFRVRAKSSSEAKKIVMNYLETQDGNRSGIDMVSTTQGSYNCIAIVTGKNVETGELRSFSWYGDDLDQLRKSLLERCNKGPYIDCSVRVTSCRY